MMAPGHVAVFVEEFTHEWNRLHAERGAARDATTRELQTVERKLAKLVDAITEGLRGASLQRQLDALESRKAALEVGLRAAGERIHPVSTAALVRRPCVSRHLWPASSTGAAHLAG